MCTAIPPHLPVDELTLAGVEPDAYVHAELPNRSDDSARAADRTGGPVEAREEPVARSVDLLAPEPRELSSYRFGRADVMLAGGSEAPITRVAIAGFSAMRALSQRNDDPVHASRPFEANRDGFVMGEAGAVLVLEELGHATRRDARIYAELVGYGVSSDAQHLTEPDPTGQSPARAMRMGFADARISPDQIDYINAHGTSTPLGDASETRVIKRALGEHIARRVPVSSTKGATGHSLGASGAVEAIFCALAIHEGVLPPTINYETPDPECDLDYVPNEAREANVGVAVSNSSGFGGHNTSIVLRRFSG
jgi:3-oxoacyl-[acyl-carrier-protein] synthase II